MEESFLGTSKDSSHRAICLLNLVQCRPARGSRGPCVEDGHPLAIVQSNPSLKHGGPTVGNTSLENQCAVHSHKFEKRKVMWPECGAQEKRVGHERYTGCTVQQSWMGTAHLWSCFHRNASALEMFTAYLVGRFPWTLRLGPPPHTTKSRNCSGRKICYTYYSSSRTWDRVGSSVVALGCVHNAQSVTATPWHLSSLGTTPCSRNSGGPRCSSRAGQFAMHNMGSFS